MIQSADAPKNSSPLLGLGENETQPTIGEGGSRIWIYARETKGTKTRQRNLVAWILLVIYLGIPWIQWGEAPLIQVDVFQFRLLLLGHSYYPQDIKLFLPGFLSFIVLVFLFTAKFGRAWCGWACPQTVFLQFVFSPLERWIEGRAAKRQARDAAGFSFDLVWRKIAKHVLFLTVAFLIGNTALAYFWGRDNVLWVMRQTPAENPSGFAFVLAFTAVFYWVFSYFKEQACVLICPYARFQSVLLDEHSLIVGYDSKRGEPRGRIQNGSRTGLGDCVDCHHCVNVCPTGIDIRKGQQLECIACTRCIDACDSIMTAWKKPPGLIRYTSLSKLDGGIVRNIRKRLVVYAVLATVLAGISAVLVFTRPDVAVDVVRRGFNPYTKVGEDSVLNTFTLHVRNKDLHRRAFSLNFAEPFHGHHNWESRRFAVGAGQLQTLEFNVMSQRNEFQFGKRDVKLEIRDGNMARAFNIVLVGPFGTGGIGKQD